MAETPPRRLYAPPLAAEFTPSGERILPHPARAPTNQDALFPKLAQSDDEAPTIARSDSTRPPTAEVCGKYDLIRRLATGGMAEVFLAREPVGPGASRPVVIKRVLPTMLGDPMFAQMFLDEARLGMRLQHPNICHTYGFGQHERVPFIAMEWILGVSLGKLLSRANELGEPIPLPVIGRIFTDIANALNYAHQATDEQGRALNVVHRDVSPHNIMVRFDGTVKLLDFGVAKTADQKAVTKAGFIKGKFAYMSPEQCRGKKLDFRSDLFSLGVCLYETVTGHHLYRVGNEVDTMIAIVKNPVPSIRDASPELPADLDDLVARALAKKPDDRFKTAGEMGRDLARCLEAHGGVAPQSAVLTYLRDLFPEELASDDGDGSTELDLPMIEVAAPLTPPRRSGFALKNPSTPEDLGDEEVDIVVEKTMYERSGKAASPSDPFDRVGQGGPLQWMARSPSLMSTKQWAIVVLVSSVVAAGLGVAIAQLAQPAPTPQAPPAFRSAPRHQSSSVRDVGQRVRVDPTPTVSPTTTPPENQNGEPETSSSDAAAVVETSPATLAAHPPSLLTLHSSRPLRVYAGRYLLGTTPIDQLIVRPGVLQLRLVERTGQMHRRRVQVRPGGHAHVMVEL